MPASRLRPVVHYLLIAGACVAVSPEARANGNHQSAPLGGRSALMGGTGVALGVDGAAPFLNPATIARIEEGSLAFSSRFFRFSERTVVGFHQPGPVDGGIFGPLELGETTLSESEIVAIPDSACYFFGSAGPRRLEHPAGRQRFAVCLAKEEESDLFFGAIPFQRVGGGRIVDQTQSLHHEWSRRSGGPSWGYYLTDRLSVGASLFVTRSKYRQVLSASTVVEEQATGAAVAASYHSSLNAYSWELLAHVGAAYRVSEAVTLGASLRTPAMHLVGSADYGSFASFDDGTPQEGIAVATGTYVARPPPRVGLGVGAEWGRLRIELDAFFYAGQSEYAQIDLERDTVQTASGTSIARGSDRLELRDDLSPIANGGVGVEYFVARDLALVGGFETDFSALPEREGASIERRVFRSRLDVLATSVGMAYYGRRGDLLLGLRGDYASGEMAVANPFVEPNRLEIADQREWGIMLIVAGRISLRNLGAAAERVDDALNGAAPEPADKPVPPLQPRTP